MPPNPLANPFARFVGADQFPLAIGMPPSEVAMRLTFFIITSQVTLAVVVPSLDRTGLNPLPGWLVRCQACVPPIILTGQRQLGLQIRKLAFRSIGGKIVDLFVDPLALDEPVLILDLAFGIPFTPRAMQQVVFKVDLPSHLAVGVPPGARSLPTTSPIGEFDHLAFLPILDQPNATQLAIDKLRTGNKWSCEPAEVG